MVVVPLTKTFPLRHDVMQQQPTGRKKLAKTKTKSLSSEDHDGHFTRKQGRPFQRWVDDIKTTAGGTCMARNRKLWRKLEEAFANQGQTDGDAEAV
ncbi:jg15929 [Pararge aegeria aegeria]|uniref:Jg15929 protein n=1 Tax=Pararge aegeria aegeria TaxID=348720 RepID=A0A8S4S1H0_9NEOP|nr:jg15929 [Pararge aegeria aegeria]